MIFLRDSGENGGFMVEHKFQYCIHVLSVLEGFSLMIRPNKMCKEMHTHIRAYIRIFLCVFVERKGERDRQIE